jgi:surface antigen
VRTQSSGGYQCTELAHRYLTFKWSVKSVPNGNAGTWCDGTIPTGLVKATTPMHGDLIVFAPGSCGADATTGHVAVIDVVNTDSTVTFVEQNSPGRRSCANTTAACFLHATANTGVPIDGGTQDGAGSDSRPALIDDANPRTDTATDRGKSDAPSTGGVAGSGGMAGSGGIAGSGGTAATGGSLGFGGTVGTGGSTGGRTSAGGTVGTGGNQGSGGVTGAGGTGGTSTTVAGSGGSPGASTGPATSSNNGCSCRLAGAPQTRSGDWDALVILALAVGLIASRRRASRPRAKT